MAEFASYWPHHPEAEGAEFMNPVQKYVVSSTLQNIDAWQNSTLIDGANFVAEIQRLKSLPGKQINVTGSAKLVQSLLRENLLDELQLLLHPIVVGGGKRLLEGDTGQAPLQLVDSQTFDTGVHPLAYQAGPTGSKQIKRSVVKRRTLVAKGLAVGTSLATARVSFAQTLTAMGSAGAPDCKSFSPPRLEAS